MKINYHNRKFRILSNSDNGEVSESLIFHYTQKGNILSCHYTDDYILAGHILGIVEPDGTIQMRYHQVNAKHELRTGTCVSTPEILPSGKIKINESWQWTDGGGAAGFSVLEEI